MEKNTKKKVINYFSTTPESIPQYNFIKAMDNDNSFPKNNRTFILQQKENTNKNPKNQKRRNKFNKKNKKHKN